MWVFYSIRFESTTRVSYVLGHSRITDAPPGASVINITAWPSQTEQQGVYYYNAFIANITDEEQFNNLIRYTEEEDEDYEAMFDSDTSDEGGGYNDDDSEGGGGGGGRGKEFDSGSCGEGTSTDVHCDAAGGSSSGTYAAGISSSA